MQPFLIFCTGIAWAALIGRYVAGAHFQSVSQTVHYFSYFTILANLLAALTFTEMALAPANGMRRLSRPALATATTLYMAVTGLSTLPPRAWLPQQWPVRFDSILHYLLPMLFFAAWMIAVPKGNLSFRQIPKWLIFPLCYGIYSQVFGPFYRAFDAAALGLPQMLSNTSWMAICFVSLSANLVVIDHALGRQVAPQPGLSGGA